MPRGQLQTPMISLRCSELTGSSQHLCVTGRRKGPHARWGLVGQSHVCLQLPLPREFREKIRQETARKGIACCGFPGAQHGEAPGLQMRPPACARPPIPGAVGATRHGWGPGPHVQRCVTGVDVGIGIRVKVGSLFAVLCETEECLQWPLAGRAGQGNL